MSSLFLCDDLAVVPVETGDTVELTGDEARHAVTVNRMRVGEHTTIGDGRGLLVHGIVTHTEARRLEIVVESVERHDEPSPRLVLVQALAKGDRDELAIQAATELGVAGVVPWQAERSVSRWSGPKIAKGVERWSTIVREAAKQSIRPWVPVVEEPVDTKALVALAAEHRVLVLEPTAETRLSALDLGDVDPRGGVRATLLVVGPEGGISPRELEALTAAGAELVRLGDEVLRTSTAGPAALAVANVALGRW
ncbi:16S rRNA (uracil(1498)-N(3))-methyltransferase [Herbiconiux sp. P15]|uniref:16S rRNA (uracil(1498)-N(3))-methyltransferase n=1 Tax=Herbiconiux liukaitaii TaxID=3342799 RepID=UPI0035BAC099